MESKSVSLLILSIGQKCIFSSIWQVLRYLKMNVMSVFFWLNLHSFFNHPQQRQRLVHWFFSCIINYILDKKSLIIRVISLLKKETPSLPVAISPSLNLVFIVLFHNKITNNLILECIRRQQAFTLDPFLLLPSQVSTSSSLSEQNTGTFLIVQWLRIHFPTQGMQV